MEYPKRVLHVVVNMNRGGAETLIMNIYRNIDRTKIQFDFLVHKKDGDYEAEICKLGGKIFRIPYVTDVGHFAYYKALKIFFAEHPGYKIVHSHMDCMSGLVMKAAKKSDIPMRISHSHSTKSEGNIIARLYKRYINFKILSNSNHLLACSTEAANWLYGKNIQNFTIIKNGINIDEFCYSMEKRKNVRSHLNISSDRFVIGHVGRFSQPKNHDFLIDVFELIHKQRPDSLLLLIGDGPLLPVIKSKVKRLYLENSILFLGVRNDVAELLQVMDAFIFPSHYEGVPLAIMEAQASGLKCVVSDAVSRDIDIGADLVTFINLKDDINRWTKELISPYKRREDTGLFLKNKSFDIVSTSYKILDLYNSGGAIV